MKDRGACAALVLALVASTLVACGSAGAEGTSGTVTLGVISDRTGPTISSQGPWFDGFTTAINAENAAPGALAATIKVVSQDDKYDPAAGLAAYKELIAKQSTLAVVATNPGLQSVLAKRLDRDKIPVVAGMVPSRDAIRPLNDWFFSVPPNYGDQVDVMTAYAATIVKNPKPKVALINNGTVTGHEVEELLEAKFGSIESVVLPPAATSADAQVQKVTQGHPDYVILHGNPSGANLVLRAIQKQGLGVPVVGVAQAGGPTVFKEIAPEVTKQYHYVAPFTPASAVVPGTKTLIEAAKASGFEAEASISDFVNGYVVGRVMIKALVDAGDQPTRKTVKTGMEAIDDLDTGGLSGRLGFGPDDHLGLATLRIAGWDPAKRSLTFVGDYDDFEKYLTNAYGN